MRGHPYLSMASPSLRGENFFTSCMRWTARSRSKSGPIRVRRSPHIAPPWPTLTPVLDCPAGTLELLSEKTNAHSNLIMSVAFSPDGTKIVSGSADKTIKVWDSGAPSPQNCASFWPKLTPAGLSGRCAGAAEREDGRPQQLDHVGGVFPGRDQDRVGIVGQDDQSLGCRCVGALESPLLGQN